MATFMGKKLRILKSRVEDSCSCVPTNVATFLEKTSENIKVESLGLLQLCANDLSLSHLGVKWLET